MDGIVVCDVITLKEKGRLATVVNERPIGLFYINEKDKSEMSLFVVSEISKNVL
jgi:hypothetical protein